MVNFEVASSSSFRDTRKHFMSEVAAADIDNALSENASVFCLKPESFNTKEVKEIVVTFCKSFKGLSLMHIRLLHQRKCPCHFFSLWC